MADSQTEARLNVIEKALNDIQVAITNLASMAQLRQFNVIKQAEINDLKERVAKLESEIQILQNS